MIKKLLIAALVSLGAGCSDKLHLTTFNGTYAGQFYYVEPGKSLSEQVSGPASVSFSGGNYTSSGSSNRIPAGGSGKFDVLKDKVVDFNDENMWTANFDWGLVLNGKYNYELKGDSLILTRYTEPCLNCETASNFYQYRLKRIN